MRCEVGSLISIEWPLIHSYNYKPAALSLFEILAVHLNYIFLNIYLCVQVVGFPKAGHIFRLYSTFGLLNGSISDCIPLHCNKSHP